MRDQTIKIRPWVFTLMYYLIYLAVVLRMLPHYWNQPGQYSIIAFLAFYLVLLSLEKPLVMRARWIFYLYSALQLTVICLLFLIPTHTAPQDYFVNLVLPLCGQAIWDFRTRAARYLVAFFALFCLVALVITYPSAEGVGFGVTYIVGCLLIAILSTATLDSIEAKEETQKILVELQQANQKLRDYSQQVEQLAAAEERNRLARELHDSVSQTIFSMTLTAQAVKMLISNDNPKISVLLEQLQNLSQSALVEMRTLIQELRPTSIAEKGLIDAIRDHAALRKRQDGLEIELDIHSEAAVSQSIAETLFRVVQEALNNICKHAQTRQATIRISEKNGKLRMSIEDPGVGFDLEKIPAHSEQFGLHSMQERVHGLGGSLKIESTPGRGTRIIIENIPLQVRVDEKGSTNPRSEEGS